MPITIGGGRYDFGNVLLDEQERAFRRNLAQQQFNQQNQTDMSQHIGGMSRAGGQALAQSFGPGIQAGQSGKDRRLAREQQAFQNSLALGEQQFNQQQAAMRLEEAARDRAEKMMQWQTGREDARNQFDLSRGDRRSEFEMQLKDKAEERNWRGKTAAEEAAERRAEREQRAEQFEKGYRLDERKLTAAQERERFLDGERNAKEAADKERWEKEHGLKKSGQQTETERWDADRKLKEQLAVDGRKAKELSDAETRVQRKYSGRLAILGQVRKEALTAADRAKADADLQTVWDEQNAELAALRDPDPKPKPDSKTPDPKKPWLLEGGDDPLTWRFKDEFEPGTDILTGKKVYAEPKPEPGGWPLAARIPAAVASFGTTETLPLLYQGASEAQGDINKYDGLATDNMGKIRGSAMKEVPMIDIAGADPKLLEYMDRRAKSRSPFTIDDLRFWGLLPGMTPKKFY